MKLYLTLPTHRVPQVPSTETGPTPQLRSGVGDRRWIVGRSCHDPPGQPPNLLQGLWSTNLQNYSTKQELGSLEFWAFLIHHESWFIKSFKKSLTKSTFLGFGVLTSSEPSRSSNNFVSHDLFVGHLPLGDQNGDWSLGLRWPIIFASSHAPGCNNCQQIWKIHEKTGPQNGCIHTYKYF